MAPCPGQGLSKSFSEGEGMWKFPEGAARGVCLRESSGDSLSSFQAKQLYFISLVYRVPYKTVFEKHIQLLPKIITIILYNDDDKV